MTPEERAIEQNKHRGRMICENCPGPQRNQPFCPCRMMGVEIVDNNYYSVGMVYVKSDPTGNSDYWTAKLIGPVDADYSHLAYKIIEEEIEKAPPTLAERLAAYKEKKRKLTAAE
jgi:hypothetical protein